MRKRTWKLAAAALGIVVVGAACSTTSTNGTTGGSNGNNSSHPTYTIGVLTDLTGEAASGNKTSPLGVKAGTVLAKRDGYNIKYVVADTTTSPTGALQAAQQLVEQDHVFAVLAVSSLTFSAANYLTQQHIPVVGVAEDGPEWITAKNMFSVYGPLDLTKVASTVGEFFKMAGGTNVGSLGYSISPSSAESAESAGVSAKAAGLKAGYVNATFPFGSTNVEPVALAMKNAGVNAVTASVDPNTGYALITALRQAGDHLKVALLPTGYGGDLLQAGPGAMHAAQGVYFLASFEPIEMHTAATEQLASDMKAAGVTHDPTYAEYAGYTSVALLVDGFKAAGANPSQAALITALSNLHHFTAAGLFGSHSLDLSVRNGDVVGVDNCYWVTKLSGSTFKLVSGADPICGHVIQGKSVSPPS
jgi:ABC-type branched-subunit amino acid transport system substrate-binding protein